MSSLFAFFRRLAARRRVRRDIKAIAQHERTQAAMDRWLA